MGLLLPCIRIPTDFTMLAKIDTLLSNGQQIVDPFEKQNVVLVNATWSILVEKKIEGNCKISKCTFRSLQNPTTIAGLPHVHI